MTYSGRDPRREVRRAGDDGGFVLGADGKPLRDRYGRPVRRRPSGRRADAGRRPDASRVQPPRAGQGAERRVARPKREPMREPARDRQQRPRPAEGRSRQARRLGQSRPVSSARPAAAPQSNETRALPPRDTPPRDTPPRDTSTRRPRQEFTPLQQSQPRQSQPQQVQPQAQPSQQPRLARSYWEEANPDPARQRKAHSRRKPVNPLKRIFGCFGWLVAIVLVCTLVLGLWADSRLTRTEALPPGGESGAGTNWLLVGSDSREGLSDEDIERLGTGGDVGVGRTDTIMVLHIPRSGKAQLVSIPRDSYVNVPGFGEDKINAAFTYGGPELLAETIEGSTGLHMDHYAEIGMGGLANLVDSVGGVDMCPEEPIDDPLAGISLQPGCQNFDGPTSLGYVRTRATAQGDLDRVQRQRDFFSALLHKITSPATILNPVRMVSLVDKTTGYFTVNKGDHVWHLAHVALAMAGGVETKTVPLGGFMDTEVGSVVLWDDEASQQLFDSMK